MTWRWPSCCALAVALLLLHPSRAALASATVQLAVPLLRKWGVKEATCVFISRYASLPFLVIEGSEYSLNIAGLPPKVRDFLMKTGLSGLTVDMPNGRFKSLELTFSNAPRNLALGIDSTTEVSARFKIIKKEITPTPAPTPPPQVRGRGRRLAATLYYRAEKRACSGRNDWTFLDASEQACIDKCTA